MKKVTIQAYEDRSRAEGGHAVILLHGLARPKGAVVFRIRPVDATRMADGTGGWIGGEHVPVSITSTDQGLELVAGPGVTESEHLLAGTVVEIEIPAASVRGEFLWPNIAPLMRPKRKNIVVNKPRGTPRAEPAVPPVMAMPAIALLPKSPAPSMAALTLSPRPEPQRIEPRHTTANFEPPRSVHDGPAESSPVAPEPIGRGAAPEDGSVDEAPMKENWPYGARAGAQTPEEVTTEEIAKKHGWAFRKDVSVMLSKKFFALGASRHDGVQEEAVHSTSGSGVHHHIAAEATAILAHKEEEEASGQHSEHYAPVQPELYQPAFESSHTQAGAETFYPHARGSVISGSNSAQRPPQGWSGKRPPLSAGVLAAIATLVVGGIGGVALLSGQASVGANNASATPVAAAVSGIAASKAGDGAPAGALLFDALSVGATSPRGASATGVAAAKALENANLQLLATGAARDTEEGAFWLKQYIAGTLGDDRTVRVLTQLGSVYAEPTGRAPDYAKARMLWEIASAAGDPVAMCFLGLLHENGLGVAADKSSARQWYERSKDRGGCPNVDESLSRVRQ